MQVFEEEDVCQYRIVYHSFRWSQVELGLGGDGQDFYDLRGKVMLESEIKNQFLTFTV